MISHQPAKSGGHKYCGSEYLMLSMLKRKIPDALASICHYCLSVKGMT